MNSKNSQKLPPSANLSEREREREKESERGGGRERGRERGGESEREREREKEVRCLDAGICSYSGWMWEENRRNLIGCWRWMLPSPIDSTKAGVHCPRC